MTSFELRPVYSSVRSFYKKAMVQPFPGGMILYSYGTPVCTVYNGELFRHWDSWSATTARHVNEFLQQCGLSAINKAEWTALPVRPAEAFTRRPWGDESAAV